MDISLAGRRAIGVGSSRRIERAIATGLAMSGVDVALPARNAQDLSPSVGERSDEFGVTTGSFPQDLSSSDGEAVLVDECSRGDFSTNVAGSLGSGELDVPMDADRRAGWKRKVFGEAVAEMTMRRAWPDDRTIG